MKIKVTVKNKCIECENYFNDEDLCQILNKGTDCYSEDDEDQLSGKYICKRCLEDSEGYGRCDFCSEDVAFHARDLKYSESGESFCTEHISETVMDDEEAEGWDDYSDYVNKD